MGMITVTKAETSDEDAIWRMLEPVLRAGEVYLLPRDWSREEALEYWFSPGHHVFVAKNGGETIGTYYLHANQRGGGAHVANCGYLTAQGRTGGGVATAMCLHSLEKAAELGFRAMQFNCVVSTNERAVALWHRLGFATVGRVPQAFEHPTRGFVDTLVMYRPL
jgi:ribosomal protein S18 acetylase RimI-like enzyme